MKISDVVSQVINDDKTVVIGRGTDQFVQAANWGHGEVRLGACGRYDAEHMEELGFHHVPTSNGVGVWERSARGDVPGAADAISGMLGYVLGSDGEINDPGAIDIF